MNTLLVKKNLVYTMAILESEICGHGREVVCGSDLCDGDYRDRQRKGQVVKDKSNKRWR